MTMTAYERDTKDWLMKKLRKQGYGTYAKLLNIFDLNLTNDPGVIGYMEPKEGRIVINPVIDEEQVSVVVRHEIMHFYLEHAARIFKKVAAEHGFTDLDAIDDLSADELDAEIYGDPDALFNIAADYEISNRAYTDADKAIIRSMHALVTEDDHSDWVDLTVEEMYDKLREERKNRGKIVYGAFIDPTTFIAPDPRGGITVYGS